jgi:hypothetical protein
MPQIAGVEAVRVVTLIREVPQLGVVVVVQGPGVVPLLPYLIHLCRDLVVVAVVLV